MKFLVDAAIILDEDFGELYNSDLTERFWEALDWWYHMYAHPSTPRHFSPKPSRFWEQLVWCWENNITFSIGFLSEKEIYDFDPSFELDFPPVWDDGKDYPSYFYGDEGYCFAINIPDNSQALLYKLRWK